MKLLQERVAIGGAQKGDVCVAHFDGVVHAEDRDDLADGSDGEPGGNHLNDGVLRRATDRYDLQRHQRRLVIYSDEEELLLYAHKVLPAIPCE